MPLKPQFNSAPPNMAPASNDTINVWAFTAVTVFEKCPYEAYLKYAKRIKVEITDDSHAAMNRGNKIHDQAEHYVDGTIGDMPAALNKFERDFELLRENFNAGKVELEQQWGVDRAWQPVSWRDPTLWGRIKLDAFVHESETSAVCIDYKTGKKFGNEHKHLLQNMFYVIGAFQRYPKLEYIQGEFWYLDHGVKLEKAFTRKEAEILLPRLDKRAAAVTNARTFPPRPSLSNCKYCDYKKSGDCQWAE
jgi:hypothetical protein